MRKTLQVKLSITFVDVDEEGEMGDTRGSQEALIKGKDWTRWIEGSEQLQKLTKTIQKATYGDPPDDPDNRQSRRKAARAKKPVLKSVDGDKKVEKKSTGSEDPKP